MLIQVTENGRPIAFNASEFVWVETMPDEAAMRAENIKTGKDIDYKHASKTRIVLKTGFVYVDESYDEVIDLLCRDAVGSLAPIVRVKTK